MPLVFACGTLKRGFPLHERGLSDARFVGAARTLQAHPLVIAGDRFAPMILREPGVGKQVAGELFELDTSALTKLDWIEGVGEPGNSATSRALRGSTMTPSRRRGFSSNHERSRCRFTRIA
jgi:gamma-glutamylaminecyclotransferase